MIFGWIFLCYGYGNNLFFFTVCYIVVTFEEYKKKSVIKLDLDLQNFLNNNNLW